METLKVKDHQIDANPPLGDMLKSCKTDFLTLGSWVTLREGKKFDWEGQY